LPLDAFEVGVPCGIGLVQIGATAVLLLRHVLGSLQGNVGAEVPDAAQVRLAILGARCSVFRRRLSRLRLAGENRRQRGTERYQRAGQGTGCASCK